MLRNRALGLPRRYADGWVDSKLTEHVRRFRNSQVRSHLTRAQKCAHAGNLAAVHHLVGAPAPFTTVGLHEPSAAPVVHRNLEMIRNATSPIPPPDGSFFAGSERTPLLIFKHFSISRDQAAKVHTYFQNVDQLMKDLNSFWVPNVRVSATGKARTGRTAREPPPHRGQRGARSPRSRKRAGSPRRWGPRSPKRRPP